MYPHSQFVYQQSERHIIAARRRDRHGRGARGITILPTLPIWKTISEQFINLVSQIINTFTLAVPEVSSIEFAVEEVPPSDPAEWEEYDVVLSRVFPRDKRRRLNDRIVLYRRPILARTTDADLPDFVATLLAYRISQILLIDPEDLFTYMH